jgi:hypothetical protein
MPFQLENPYLDEFESIMPEWRVPPHLRKLTMERYMARQRMVARYAWAIPTTEAIELLLRFAPLVEMGAGTGYWAWLVRQAGGDILAFDRYPPPDRRNRWHAGERQWTEVLPGGPRRLTRHPGRTLLLCWPPQDEPMTQQCLQVYEGQTLIYAGELNATDLDGRELPAASPSASTRLSHPFDGWAVAEALELPRWESVNDRLFVLRRTKVERTPNQAITCP